MAAMLTTGAFFSGIGGFCVGFERSGFRTDWATDHDDGCARTYKLNFPRTRFIEEDITNLAVETNTLRSVDVVHAGFPCQSFSQAGNRRGFRDPRGRLFFELMRVIREFGPDKPSVLVLENAPFLRLGDGGAWFIEIQREIQRAGYWFRSTNCAELDPFLISDLPQQRNRLFMVAFSTDRFRNGRLHWPSAREKNSKNLADYVAFEGEQNEEYYLSSDNRYFNMITKHVDSQQRLYQLRKYEVRPKPPNMCPTLTANMGAGGHNVPFLIDSRGLRKLTERECAKLQGFPDQFQFPTSLNMGQRYSQIGNSVAVPVAEQLAAEIRAKIEMERDK